MLAFSRDPARLFPPPAPPPAARSSKQPVVYVGAVPGTHTVTVDWVRGRVAAYASREDVLNRVPFHQSDQLPAVPAEHVDVYVREAFGLFLRGHSLLGGACTCPTSRWLTSPERAASLGLPWTSSSSSVGCTAGFLGEARPLREVALELGLHAVTDALLGTLTQCAGFEHHDGLLWLPACCVPRVITGGQDLLRAARVLAPRPYVYEPSRYDMLDRQAFQKELRALMRTRIVRAVPTTDDGWAIFWNGDALHLEPLTHDDDPNSPLRRAWRAQGSRQQKVLEEEPEPPPKKKKRRLLLHAAASSSRGR